MVFHKKQVKLLAAKRDFIYILILTAIAFVLGLYLIITTVLIAKDGVLYIELAQQLALHPKEIIKAHPPGYPMLISMAHTLASSFSLINDASNQGWIYSAQSITLLCRLLAIIPLYYIGRLLVGRRNSFWAMLILILLPNSAEFGCDVLREWPYLLFLATGFFFLLWGAKYGKWWAFGFIGLSSGLGYLIRHESAQLVLYGIIWLILCILRPKQDVFSRHKSFASLFLLLSCFAIPVIPYMQYTERIFPPKVNYLINSFSSMSIEEKEPSAKPDSDITQQEYHLAGANLNIIKNAFYEIFQAIGETLMWFFMPALLIGLWSQFRFNIKCNVNNILKMLMLFNILLITLRYHYILQSVSQRWTLPLAAFTIYYIPIGLRIINNWFVVKWSCLRKRSMPLPRKRFPAILFLIGISICMPKLLRPIRSEKCHYIAVARWLKENTTPNCLVAGDDLRIGFYAERTMKRMHVGTHVVSGGHITADSWYHVAGTYDGKYQKLYINGRVVASAEPRLGDLNSVRRSLAIGRQHTQSDSYFKGVIDEVQLYNRSLSEKEVELLFEDYDEGKKTSGLVGYWPLEGDIPGMKGLPNKAQRFDGVSDYINLSHFGTRLNTGNLGFSFWIKPELSQEMNWILGNKAQFCVGIDKTEVHFWIQEKQPGRKIPEQADFLVLFENEKNAERIFNKKVNRKYYSLPDKKKKGKRIAIYEVL